MKKKRAKKYAQNGQEKKECDRIKNYNYYILALERVKKRAHTPSTWLQLPQFGYLLCSKLPTG
jgi:hypothetical protein